MISIIIPTFNEEKYLPKVLASIKKQDFRDYEIIVADNHSKDRTVKIAKSFGCRIAKGGLPSKGRNEGARISKGSILVFLDADVKLPSESFLGKAVSEFRSRDLAVATCLSSPDSINHVYRILYFLSNIFVWSVQGIKPHGAGYFVMAKRETFNKLKGFDEAISLGEDVDFFVRSRKFGRFGVLGRRIVCSTRRFKKEGIIRSVFKIIKSTLYELLGRKKKGIEYKFGGY